MKDSVKKAISETFPTSEVIQDGLKAIDDFRKMTLEQFLALPPQERGFTGGAIMGNFSAHHPAEAFSFLKAILNLKKDHARRM